MKRKINMIVTDLDKTLIRTDKSISQYSLEVFDQCKEKGILIALATARSEEQAKRYIELLKPDIIISNGGSLARYQGKTIYKSLLSIELSNQIIKECILNSNCGDIVVQTDTAYYSNGKDLSKYGSDFSHAQYNDYSDSLNSMTHKIAVEVFDENFTNALTSQYPDCSGIRFSGERWYRFAHKDATKLKAINKLIKYLDFKLEEVVAFGDDYNDIEMIKNCYGIAVANAINEAQAIAKYVTMSNDEDGVADYIDRYILSDHNFL